MKSYAFRNSKKRRTYNSSAAIMSILYLSYPVHRVNVHRVRSKEFCSIYAIALRIPKSRFHLLEKANKQLNSHLLMRAFANMKLLLEKMRNLRVYYKERVVRKSFLYLKHRSIKKKALRNNFDDLMVERSLERINKYWQTWKAKHITTRGIASKLNNLTLQKNEDQLNKAWDKWRKNFLAAQREKNSLTTAINHRALNTKLKCFNILFDRITDKSAKHKRLLKSQSFYYNNHVGRMFDAWRDFAEKKLHQKYILEQKLKQTQKQNRLLYFEEWFNLYSEVTVGRQAFSMIQGKKMFAWLRGITEYSINQKALAEKHLERHQKSYLRTIIKAWSTYTSQRVRTKGKFFNLYKDWMILKKRKYFMLFKKRTSKKLKLTDAYETSKFSLQQKILLKCFKSLESYKNFMISLREKSEKIQRRRAKLTRKVMFYALKRFTTKNT